MKKEYPILDFAVLQPGQTIKCCLDWDNIDYIKDDDGEDTEDILWWTGIITAKFYSEEYDADMIQVDILDEDRRDWGVILLEEHKKYMKLVVNEWDD